MRHSARPAALCTMGLAMAASAGALAETSRKLGTLDQAIQQGYTFAGYGTFGAEAKTVGVNAQGKQGSMFMKKGNELAICEFSVVLSNPAKGPGAAPASACYEVK